MIPKNAKVVLPPHGFIHLEASNATDISVVNAARVSFAQKTDVMTEGDEKVLRFLMRERHGSPFEHNFFSFRVKAPIFVFREWMRHRISSFNEMSGRYTKLLEEFYLPELDQVREQVGKPGSYKFSKLDPETAKKTRTILSREYKDAWDAYQEMIDLGVAKEVARIVLPVATYSQMIWSVNARSLMNFLSLRNHKDAQYEIRVYGEAIEELFESQMPITYSAFIENGRRAP